MPWDEELKQLQRQVIDTFGEAETDAAQWRVLTRMQWPESCWGDYPPDPETQLALVRDALRTEYRLLMQPH
jgi:hypothetical protein